MLAAQLEGYAGQLLVLLLHMCSCSELMCICEVPTLWMPPTANCCADFLDRTIGHFYNRADDSSSSSSTQQPPSTPSGDIEQGKPPASGSSGGAGQAAAQAGSRWWAPWRRRVQSSSSEGKDQAACAASEGGKEEAKSEGGSGGKQLEWAQWVPKSKAAFIQTPQDFFNVDASDPVRARLLAASVLFCGEGGSLRTSFAY